MDWDLDEAERQFAADLDEQKRLKCAKERQLLRNDRRYELAKVALIELISGPRDYALDSLPERALWLADDLLARLDGVEGCHDGDLQT